MNPHPCSLLTLPTPTWIGFVSLLSTMLLICPLANPTQITAQQQGWSATGSLGTARSGHTATLLGNGRVLVVGGINVTNPCCSTTGSAELYDPATKTWSYTANLNTARRGHTATMLLNGKVLVAGGSSNDANVLNSAELYDPAKGTWSYTGNLKTAGGGTATLLPNGKVLVVGGKSAELYDPGTGTWSGTGNLNTASCCGTATLLPNGKVLVTSGYHRNSLQRSAELYDPASGSWTATSDLITARLGATATPLPNGKVLVAGGALSDHCDGLYTPAELYDPATGDWSTTGRLTAPRSGHTATLLPNGKVLVAAGDFECDLLNSAELYDPATGSWSVTGSLIRARAGHTATLLANGKVLVAGGDNYGSLTSAELFDSGTTFEELSLFVPLVQSFSGVNNTFFTSELTLTNRSIRDVPLNFTYAAIVGDGSGTASDMLAAGRQRIIPDAIAYLKSLDIPIPDSGNRGGSLVVRFSGLSSSSEGSVLVRTTTAVPEGRAGLAYAGIPTSTTLGGPSYVCGLRQNATDRTNLAIHNTGTPSEGVITLRLTVFSGDPAAPFSYTLPDQTLSPGGFYRIANILQSNGMSLNSGYVRVERVSGTAPYYAYALIHDQANADGVLVAPIAESSLAGRRGLTLPVIVESSTLSSELVLTNWSATKKSLHFAFVDEATQTQASSVDFVIELNAQQQMILPNFVEWLRQHGVSGVGSANEPHVGSLYVTAEGGGDVEGIFLGARTSKPGQRGRYSSFYVAVPQGMASTDSAWLYGLQQNSENRTNVALINVGDADGGTNSFTVELFGGETGLKVNTIDGITLKAMSWTQFNSFLACYAPGTTQAYARVKRTGGSNAFITYAVISDGAHPGERSGDAVFVSSSP